MVLYPNVQELLLILRRLYPALRYCTLWILPPGTQVYRWYLGAVYKSLWKGLESKGIPRHKLYASVIADDPGQRDFRKRLALTNGKFSSIFPPVTEEQRKNDIVKSLMYTDQIEPVDYRGSSISRFIKPKCNSCIKVKSQWGGIIQFVLTYTQKEAFLSITFTVCHSKILFTLIFSAHDSGHCKLPHFVFIPQCFNCDEDFCFHCSLRQIIFKFPPLSIPHRICTKIK